MSNAKVNREKVDGGTALHSDYAEYRKQVLEWLQDRGMLPIDLAGQLKVDVEKIHNSIRGTKYRQLWILERLRDLTGIAPPHDERPISGRWEETRRFRSLMAFIRDIEECIHIRRKSTSKGPAHGIDRDRMIKLLRELSRQARNFADFLESSVREHRADEDGAA